MNVRRVSVQSSNDRPQRPIVHWNHKYKAASTHQAAGDHAPNGIQTWKVFQNIKCRDHVKRALKDTLFGARDLKSHPGHLFPRLKNGVLADIHPNRSQRESSWDKKRPNAQPMSRMRGLGLGPAAISASRR